MSIAATREFLTLSILTLSVAAAPAYAATLQVPADYTTIGEAVDAAIWGDTVEVAAGTYDELVTVRIPLTIQGAGAETTIWKGERSSDSVHHALLNVTNEATVSISGFRFKSEYSDWRSVRAVTASDHSTVTVSNITADDFLGTQGGGVFACFDYSERVLNNTTVPMSKLASVESCMPINA